MCDGMRPGFCLWLTGLPASGKTTIALALEERLRGQGLRVEVLDGDEVRRGLSAGLGFSRQDREEHNRRVIFVARLLARNGVAVIVPLISPYREVRALARQQIPNFFEVWVRCSLEECIRRDPKGFYAKALRGEISNMTGIQDPYEEPLNPELVIDTDRRAVEECVADVLRAVGRKQLRQHHTSSLLTPD